MQFRRLYRTRFYEVHCKSKHIRGSHISGCYSVNVIAYVHAPRIFYDESSVGLTAQRKEKLGVEHASFDHKCKQLDS